MSVEGHTYLSPSSDYLSPSIVITSLVSSVFLFLYSHTMPAKAALVSPFILTVLLARKSELSTAAMIGLYAATAPVGILLAPVTVPLCIGVLAKEVFSHSHQDLSPVSDNDL